MTHRLTRRTFVSLAAATVASTRFAAAQSVPANLVYIGSTGSGTEDGIHVARWNPESGTLSDLRLVARTGAPSFLAISNHGGSRFLFAGVQTAPKSGALDAYRIAASGDLHLLNSIPDPNGDGVHTVVDHTGRCLVSANYGAGTVVSCTIAVDGQLSELVSNIQLTGHGPIESRQKAPHAHGVVISPDNRFALINDLGTDRIMIYKLNPATAELTPNDPPFFQTAPGSGPRHTAFHPNGKYAYSINELNSTITLYSWNAAAGTLTLLATTPTLPPGGDIVNNRAGEVVFDTTGRFLYACNRGAAEELLAYSVASDGHLTLLGRTPLEGKEARHFVISPDNRFLLVAKQFSNEVAIFARDRKTGILAATPARVPVNLPSCVLFA